MKRNKTAAVHRLVSDARRAAGTEARGEAGLVARVGAQRAWRERLAGLAIACAGAFPEDEDACLRDARDLLATAPDPTLIPGLVVPGSSHLDELIASGAGASAALAMFGRESGYLLSRGSSGQHLATVVLPGAEEDISACGDTVALALVGAIAQALAQGIPAASGRA